MFGGGGNPAVNSIEFINIATFGNAVDYGDLLATENGYIGAAASPIRGVFAGGNTSTASNVIQHISLQTAGDAADFGDLTVAGYGVHGLSNGHGGL